MYFWIINPVNVKGFTTVYQISSKVDKASATQLERFRNICKKHLNNKLKTVIYAIYNIILRWRIISLTFHLFRIYCSAFVSSVEPCSFIQLIMNSHWHSKRLSRYPLIFGNCPRFKSLTHLHCVVKGFRFRR